MTETSGGWRHHAAGELVSFMFCERLVETAEGNYNRIPGWFEDRLAGGTLRLEEKLVNLLFPLKFG
jgi:hypothetical protein